MVFFAPGTATWRTGRNMRVVFDSGPFAPLCENVTSCTKPVVHNTLHRRQRKTERRSQIMYRKNLMKCGHVVFDI